MTGQIQLASDLSFLDTFEINSINHCFYYMRFQPLLATWVAWRVPDPGFAALIQRRGTPESACMIPGVNGHLAE
jgi:hypothetical protein